MSPYRIPSDRSDSVERGPRWGATRLARAYVRLCRRWRIGPYAAYLAEMRTYLRARARFDRWVLSHPAVREGVLEVLATGEARRIVARVDREEYLRRIPLAPPVPVYE